MVKVYAIYRKPADARTFEDDYSGTDVPQAKTRPGLRRQEVTQGVASATQLRFADTCEV